MMDQEVWRTTLFYTFSTIAQTLAAAFAIIAVFVIFRLQSAENQILHHAGALNVLPIRVDERQRWLNRLMNGEVSAFIGWFEQFKGRPGFSAEVEQGLVLAGCGIAHLGLIQKQSGLWVRLSFVLTAGSIVLCLILLPLANFLASSLRWAVASACAPIALAIVCMYFYWRLLVSAFFPKVRVSVQRPAADDAVHDADAGGPQ